MKVGTAIAIGAAVGLGGLGLYFVFRPAPAQAQQPYVPQGQPQQQGGGGGAWDFAGKLLDKGAGFLGDYLKGSYKSNDPGSLGDKTGPAYDATNYDTNNANNSNYGEGDFVPGFDG